MTATTELSKPSPRASEAPFVPRASIMIGMALYEWVFNMSKKSVVHEVFSTNLAITEWDLARKGWQKQTSNVWSNGKIVMKIHTEALPMPSVTAMRWVYDGRRVCYLDRDHAWELRIEEREMLYLRMLVTEENGWKYADVPWLISIMRLAEVLPLPEGVTADQIRAVLEKVAASQPNEVAS